MWKHCVEVYDFWNRHTLETRNFGGDYFRALSCLMIMNIHLWGFFPNLNKWLFQIPPLLYNHATGLPSGFFILSSYLLTKRYPAYICRYHASKRAFYLRRFFRIIPLWWLFVPLLYFSCRHMFDDAPIGLIHIFFNLFFLFGFFPGDSYNFTAVGWTLFIEEWFYLVFPFVAPFFRKCYLILLLLPLYWLNLNSAALMESMTVKEAVPMYIRFFPYCLHFFALGMSLANFEKIITERKKTEAVLYSVVYLLYFPWVYLSGNIESIMAVSLVVTSLYLANFKNVLLLPIWIIGYCSYALYLLNTIVIYVLHGYFTVHSSLSAWFLFLIFNLFSLFCALLSTFVFEEYFQKVGKSFADRYLLLKNPSSIDKGPAARKL